MQIGPFDVEFIPVTHSVPHAHAVAVHTPQGVMLHSGDFKLDLTPVDDRRTDLARIGELAKTEGIRVLLCRLDERRGGRVRPQRDAASAGCCGRCSPAHRDRRIITASFASHLHRIQQIADAAIESGRKVATLGLSMRKNVQLGLDLGDRAHPGQLVRRHRGHRHATRPGEVCVISTGSQGEPMSALALLARGENRFVKLGDHDTVILSSHAIPGNESNVNRVMDGLLKAGAEVVHSGIMDVHATGHAQADELKTYLSIAQPRVVRAGARRVPPPDGQRPPRRGHGRGPRPGHRLRGRRRARAHRRGRRAGRPGARRVPVRRRHRRRRRVRACCATAGVLASEGVVVVVVTVDTQTGKVLVGPEIITRGWVYAPEAEDLLDEACDTIAAAVEKALSAGVRDVEALERDVRRAAGKFVSDRTRRRPMIVPVVMEA